MKDFKIIKYENSRQKKLASYWAGRGDSVHAAICRGIVEDYKKQLKNK